MYNYTYNIMYTIHVYLEWAAINSLFTLHSYYCTHPPPQDTAGSERYESMSRIYYRGAKAAVVCFGECLVYITFNDDAYLHHNYCSRIFNVHISVCITCVFVVAFLL